MPLVAGCGAFDYPAHRSLSAHSISVEEEGSEWILTVEVTAGATGFADDTKEAFHDVVLLAYSENWELVGRGEVGDFPDISRIETREVTVRCDGFPHRITYDARESPCERNTEITILTYQGKQENVGRVWSDTDERNCGEGLPPTGEG